MGCSTRSKRHNCVVLYVPVDSPVQPWGRSAKRAHSVLPRPGVLLEPLALVHLTPSQCYYVAIYDVNHSQSYLIRSVEGVALEATQIGSMGSVFGSC